MVVRGYAGAANMGQGHHIGQSKQRMICGDGLLFKYIPGRQPRFASLLRPDTTLLHPPPALAMR